MSLYYIISSAPLFLSFISFLTRVLESPRTSSSSLFTPSHPLPYCFLSLITLLSRKRLTSILVTVTLQVEQ
ncbi:hypothetical protein C8Q74DRAFT_1309882 [Fomes fomentarius]|nr:hypothetical protein C8Q74DRAFT_1309882 [Fomes fomentarius]